MDWKDYQEIYQVVDAAYQLLLPILIVFVLYNLATFFNLFSQHLKKKDGMSEKEIKLKEELNEKEIRVKSEEIELIKWKKESIKGIKIPVCFYKEKKGKIECIRGDLYLKKISDDIFMLD